MKNFKPTQEQLKATYELVSLQDLVNTIRPIVESYQQKEIDIMMPKSTRDGSLITHPDEAFNMSDEDANIYYKALHENHIKAGFTVKEFGNCPLLEAENLMRKAERVLCDLMKPITKIDLDDCLCSPDGMKNYRDLVNINLGFLVPFLSKQHLAFP